MNKNITFIIILLLIALGCLYYLNEKPGQMVVPADELTVETDLKTQGASVEDYLTRNIDKISPIKAVLGGVWHVVSVSIDFEHKTGTVIYEDGHIQAKGSFTYTIDENGMVSSLSINEAGELVKNFEGEADPSRMNLTMKTWEWVSATSNGVKIYPKTEHKFNLTFKRDMTFSASTDCNGIGGNYTVKNEKITFSEMLGTLMYCENSQENDFKNILENTVSYKFTSRGELVFSLKDGSGSVIFK